MKFAMNFDNFSKGYEKNMLIILFGQFILGGGGGEWPITPDFTCRIHFNKLYRCSNTVNASCLHLYSVNFFVSYFRVCFFLCSFESFDLVLFLIHLLGYLPHRMAYAHFEFKLIDNG